MRRRSANTSPYASPEDEDKALDDYTALLQRSGYTKTEIPDLVIMGIKGHERKLLQ